METQAPIQTDPPQQKLPAPAGRQIGVVVAWLFGAAVGSYCGWLLVIPLALAFGVGWVLKKLPAGPEPFRIALALVAAQALYLTADIVLGGGWLPDAAHILVLVAGFVWLWVRPGIGPVILLGLYEITTGVLITMAYGSAQTGSWQNKALVAQLFLRASAVLFLISGYLKARKA
ncbi:MAG TPA: hypothetical protein VFE51_13850 [Verrucomicrobiae bacterium]|nr:hypothetical protein [Verrucomicrobiae bacterium]